MTTKSRELLWQLQADLESDRAELEREIDAWLDEQTGVAYASDLAGAMRLLKEELSARGFSLRTH
jgi:hypothetical protein